MKPDNERDRLKQSAGESACLLLKVTGGVMAGGAVLWGAVWLILRGKILLDSYYQHPGPAMIYGTCALAWLCLLAGDFVWLTYSRFEKMQGREPAGKCGYLLLSIMAVTFAAELMLTWIIVGMIFQGSGTGDAETAMMSLTVLALMISVGIKMPGGGRV